MYSIAINIALSVLRISGNIYSKFSIGIILLMISVFIMFIEVLSLNSKTYA